MTWQKLPWALTLLPIMLLAACDPVSQRQVESATGESFTVSLDYPMGNQHRATDPDDLAGLHVEALSYVLGHPAFGYVKPGSQRKAPPGVIAKELQAPLNEILLAQGVATITIWAAPREEVTLLVSKKARFVVVRRWTQIGNWRTPYFAGFDFAEVPEAFEPQASLSLDDLNERVRFLEEPQ